MKIRVLWVEDDARFGLAQLAGPVYVHGGYDLVVASDVSTAIARLSREIFDAVIVDIRLPPGDDRAWIELYSKEGRNKVRARLGLQLLYSLLGHQRARVHLKQRPGWLASGKLGVFTVESRPEIEEDLGALGIPVYEQKRADLPDTVLLEIIERILRQQQGLPAEKVEGR
jgi:CheY-like chemotaxis protein